MTFLLLGSVSGTILGFLMGFLSLFLILLILIQRGKGGGLTGALGGPGGQSAFGSKAGDTFTVITVVVAAVWGFTCAFTMWLLGTHAPPSIANATEVVAGPGDESKKLGNEFVIPPLGGDLSSGGSGIGGVDEAVDTEPAADMVPLDADGAEPAGIAPADAAPAEAAPADASPAAETETDAEAETTP